MFKTLKNLTPPLFLNFFKKNIGYIRPALWQYMPDGFDSNISTRGWNIKSLVDLQVSKWDEFKRETFSGKPKVVSYGGSETGSDAYDIVAHNILQSYAFVLLLAAQGKKAIKVLDWGGGLGNYGIFSEEFLKSTEVKLDYTCYDLPLFCAAGSKLNHHFKYFSDLDYLNDKRYDLTLVSSSLWYEKNWKSILNLIAESTDGYLYITRMIFIKKCRSFVAIQRTPAYNTEYLCWILNENELIEFTTQLGFSLVKEIYIGPSFPIFKAPEQGNYKGFVFKRKINS